MVRNFIASVSIVFSAAVAQASEMPVLKDIPKGNGIPSGAIYDVLSVSIGMPFADARGKMKNLEGLSGNIEERKVNVGLRDSRGNEVSFVLHQSDRDRSSGNQGGLQSFTVYFSSPLVGKRVTAIHRRINYGASGQPSLPDMKKAIVGKYGKPSASIVDRSGHHRIIYSWVSGKQLVFNAAEQAALVKRHSFQGAARRAQCGYVENLSRVLYEYDHQRKRSPTVRRYTGCGAVLEFRLQPGSRADLVGYFETKAIDYHRFLADHFAIDAFLIDQVNKARDGKQASGAPKL